MVDPSRPGSRLQFALITLAASVAVVVTASLGQWQLSRAAQKRALHASMMQREAAAPLSERELVPMLAGQPADALESLLFRSVRLRGQWLPDATLYLDNRQMRGRPGFYVLTPLRLAGSGMTVAVQRGWIARDFDDRTRLPAIATPAGEVVVQGHLAGEPGRLFEFSHAAAAEGASRIRQNLALADYAAQFSLRMPPVMVVQTGAAADGLERDWPAPDSGVDMHYGYAFQWFGLCGLVLFLYVWFQIIRRVRRRGRPAAD